LQELNGRGISAVFHYAPLHSSTGGRRYARVHGSLATTEDAADRLVRLPMWDGIAESQISQVVEALAAALGWHDRTPASAARQKQ
jgi:dTDP-4-amino-4,6-dideoxygalactose transaminase